MKCGRRKDEGEDRVGMGMEWNGQEGGVEGGN